jgi:AraC-like DNA-binding protein
MEEVAVRVGYPTVSTFNRNFRKIVGTSPYQYKKSRDNYEGKLLNFKVSAKKGW